MDKVAPATDPAMLPAERARIAFLLGKRPAGTAHGDAQQRKRRRRWLSRDRVGSAPPIPEPVVFGPSSRPPRPQRAVATIDDLIPKDPRAMFTPVNLYRYLKHSRDTITRRLIAQEKNRDESMQGEPSLRKQLYDEMLKLSFPKADKNIRMYFRGGCAIEKLTDFKPATALHLFQKGFSLGTESTQWHEYNRHSKQFLTAIDNGILPPYISELLRHAKTWSFYDGYLILELVDYREMSEFNPQPTVKRVLLKPTAETVSGDVDRLCDIKLLNKVDESELDDLKIGLDMRILRANAPRICLDPSIRVLQVASIMNYNLNQHNAARLSTEQIARCMAKRERRDELLQNGIPNIEAASSKAFQWDGFKCRPGARPLTPAAETLLRCATFAYHTPAGACAHARNTLANDPLARSTLFSPNMPPDVAAAVSGGATRLTIQSKAKLHTPNARHVNVSVPRPGDVRSLRFFAQRNMRQMHDLFIFSRPCRLGVPDPPVSSGTYEGILKITSEGDKKPDILRFNIGNYEMTAKFVSAYITQSQREGRIMLHDKDPTNPTPPQHNRVLTLPGQESHGQSWARNGPVKHEAGAPSAPAKTRHPAANSPAVWPVGAGPRSSQSYPPTPTGAPTASHQQSPPVPIHAQVHQTPSNTVVSSSPQHAIANFAGHQQMPGNAPHAPDLIESTLLQARIHLQGQNPALPPQSPPPASPSWIAKSVSQRQRPVVASTRAPARPPQRLPP
ncbi:unnamed protein product (mitochondrion) [Plasmodiophora brassicae]|uniref:Spt20-like SEP domain-containing protein n=1 Tax=Plasmodiophora brassicae TaxID=37360 RepID=A0A3P3Y4L2_PLABS|nr:unnamed protein product [Plasmodiophora brassicae]